MRLSCSPATPPAAECGRAPRATSAARCSVICRSRPVPPRSPSSRRGRLSADLLGACARLIAAALKSGAAEIPALLDPADGVRLVPTLLPSTLAPSGACAPRQPSPTLRASMPCGVQVNACIGRISRHPPSAPRDSGSSDCVPRSANGQRYTTPTALRVAAGVRRAATA